MTLLLLLFLFKQSPFFSFWNVPIKRSNSIPTVFLDTFIVQTKQQYVKPFRELITCLLVPTCMEQMPTKAVPSVHHFRFNKYQPIFIGRHLPLMKKNNAFGKELLLFLLLKVLNRSYQVSKNVNQSFQIKHWNIFKTLQ